jgi:hypothetical protein
MLAVAENCGMAVDIPAVVAVNMSEELELSELQYNAQLQYSQALRSLDRNACFQEQNFRNWHRHAWWIVTC